MGIFDNFFAHPFGKIGVYGLIRPDFVVWALGSYILALAPGINCMGFALSSDHPENI
jgi:hypothetical protein